MQIQSIANLGMSWSAQQKADNTHTTAPGIQSIRQDQTSFSAAGKLAAMMEQLTAQKESIIQQKEDLVNRTVDAGASMESIKEPLKNLNEKLEGIDQQMAEAQEAFNQQQIAKLGERDEKEKKEPEGEEKTREEALQERMTDVVDLSGRVARSDGLSVAKANMEATARIQHAFARTDMLNADLREVDLKVKIALKTVWDPAVEGKSITRSRNLAAQREMAASLLDQRAAAIDEQITSEMSRVNKELEEDKESAPTQTSPKEDEK